MSEPLQTKTPCILLIGAGRFGKNHLRVLLELQRAGALSLAGVCVKTARSAHEVAELTKAPVYRRLTPALLQSVDAVDIVTPASTHDALLEQCLPYVHSFVEKPFSLSLRSAQRHIALARRHGHRLMVGHIFRFHPLTHRMNRLLARHTPVRIAGSFVSPAATDRGEDAVFEEMHFFDLMDFWFGEEPRAVWSRERGRITESSLRYRRFDALFEIGWDGTRKERVLHFEFGARAPWKRLTIDYVAGTLLKENRHGRTQRTERVTGPEPLTEELAAFARYVRTGETGRSAFPDARIALRVLKTVARAVPLPRARRPRVAVIGGGIFGATAALVLGETCDVTLFERHGGLLEEASFANQYRHHSGFHYPRSPETVAQIQASKRAFELFYREAIVRVQSYIAVARNGSRVSARAYERICRARGLCFRRAFPPPAFLNRDAVSASFKTDEAVYDYAALRSVILRRIRANSRIALRLAHEVTGVSLASTGEKLLRYRQNGTVRQAEFDYCINAMYANHNLFCRWLGFPERALEFRFKEILVIRLPVKSRPAVMVVDGPFATLVPIPRTTLYTFGDVPLSVHRIARSFSPAVLKRWKKTEHSRAGRMLRRCRQWFPILSRARLVESRFVVLPIDAASTVRDDRTTSLTDHGFGCFSILEGKIITAVSFAREVLARVRALEIREKRGRV